MSQCFTMKNKGPTLSAALLIVAVVLFICIFAVFVCWLDLRLQVSEENPIYRFQTLIAGLLALTAAGGTIYMMQRQIKQGRIDADRRAALDHAAYIRSSTDLLKMRLASFVSRTSCAIQLFDQLWNDDDFHREEIPGYNGSRSAPPAEVRMAHARKSRLNTFEERMARATPIRETEAINTGYMPSDVRQSIATAIYEIRLNGDQLNQPRIVGEILDRNFDGILQRWVTCEFHLVHALILLEMYAREVVANETLHGPIGMQQFSLDAVCKTEKLSLSLPGVCEVFDVELPFDEETMEIVGHIPRVVL